MNKFNPNLSEYLTRKACDKCQYGLTPTNEALLIKIGEETTKRFNHLLSIAEIKSNGFLNRDAIFDEVCKEWGVDYWELEKCSACKGKHVKYIFTDKIDLSVMQVLTRKHCSHCEARGVVLHPRFERIKQTKSEEAKQNSLMTEYAANPFQKREIPCYMCHGTGWVENWEPFVLPEPKHTNQDIIESQPVTVKEGGCAPVAAGVLLCLLWALSQLFHHLN